MRVRLKFGLILAIVALCASPSVAQPFWKIGEFQPDIPHGGRANTIAINRADESLILVASESGGLFRSANGGATWAHVDSLPEYKMAAVAFLPADPSIAVATVEADYRVANGGGVWRSADRGLTWTQVHSPAFPYNPYWGVEPFTAREISIAPDTGAIYVATSYGLSISDDQGLTWRLGDPFPADGHQVTSVLAQPGGRVIAAGPSGLRRSVDGGATWSVPSTPLTGTWDIHALAGSPVSADQAFFVDGATQLFTTEDGGDHWSPITAAPISTGTCGGIAFIKAAPRVVRYRIVSLTLYFGNRCNAYRLTPARIAGTEHYDLTGAWTQLAVDHPDPRDIGFSTRGGPLLFGSDGGLHKTADGGATWTATGNGSAGYNALQINEVISQRVTATRHIDLYFVTQDNHFWASSDFGATWPARLFGEGSALELLHQVPTDADAQLTFMICVPCSLMITGRLFAGPAPWSPPANPFSAPKIVRPSFHVQAVDDSASLDKGLAYTRDLGATPWSQYATFPEDVVALPKQSNLFVPPTSRWTVLYQAIRAGFDSARRIDINRLVRTEQSLTASATTSYPLMTNFGGLGVTRTVLATHVVFAVDPRNPNHLIAPDVLQAQMKESWDGGDTWTNRTDLTALFTADGAFKFTDGIFPQVTAISFSQDDPNLVAAGTAQTGIFISSDRGATWALVPGSERATDITALEWADPTHLIVSTYGRGLWSVIQLLNLSPTWRCGVLCHGIPARGIIDPLWDPTPERLARSLVVLDGRVQGARTAGPYLTELYVSPGSNVMWRGEGPAPEVAIHTSSEWMGLPTGLGDRRPLKGSKSVVALALSERNQPIGLVTSPRPIASTGLLPPPAPPAPGRDRPFKARAVGVTRSPTVGQPYVEIRSLQGGGSRVAPGEPLRVSARGFPPGAAVAMEVDDGPAQPAKVTAEGRLSFQVQAPRREGRHTLIARDSQGALITGAMFLVVHADEAEEGEARNRGESERRSERRPR